MSRYLIASGLILMSFSALAEPIKAEISGKLDTQWGYRQQKDTFKYKDNDNTQPKLSTSGIVNSTSITFKANHKLNNGVKYGGLIKLNADTSINLAEENNTIADKVLFFVESNYGRFEGGAYDGAPAIMQVSANNIARATGGINGNMQKWINKKVQNKTYNQALDFGQEFIKWPTLPIDCDFDSNVSKVTYYTPTISGFQFGLGYIPDVNRTGTVATLNDVSAPPVGSPLNAVKGFKDVIEGGLKYTGKFKELDIEASVIAERSRNSGKTANRRELLAYEVGALVTYKEFSVAGSYSDWTHSGAPKTKLAGKKYVGGYWTAGVAYATKNAGVSLTYFNSQRANLFTGDEAITNTSNSSNKFQVLSLGADYTVAPGLMPYAEVSFFKTKYHANPVNNKGSVLLIGTKLTF